MKKILRLGVVFVLGLVLAGCQLRQPKQATNSSSAVSTQADELQGITAQGLPKSDVKTIHEYPDAVAAVAGVSWQGASDTQMQLLHFDAEAACQSARGYYAAQNKRVYAQGKRLLVADAGMGRGWFDKYQAAIFRQ